MKEGTKEYPAPLDAFETAKPDEPIFTLQGGDPLGAPLVQLWANLARLRAGVLSYQAMEQFLWGSANAASNAKVEDDKQKDAMLLRASKAEEQGWRMAAYLRDQEFDKEPEEEPLEIKQVELFDLRVFVAQRLSNMFSELYEILQRLEAAGYNDPLAYLHMKSAFTQLKTANAIVEPRRMFRRDEGKLAAEKIEDGNA